MSFFTGVKVVKSYEIINKIVELLQYYTVEMIEIIRKIEKIGFSNKALKNIRTGKLFIYHRFHFGLLISSDKYQKHLIFHQFYCVHHIKGKYILYYLDHQHT
jgi:hypothetical protein